MHDLLQHTGIKGILSSINQAKSNDTKFGKQTKTFRCGSTTFSKVFGKFIQFVSHDLQQIWNFNVGKIISRVSSGKSQLYIYKNEKWIKINTKCK